MRFFIALMIALVSMCISSHAQHPVLYGLTGEGNGGVFEFNSKNNELKNVYRFKSSGFVDFVTSMIHSTNGMIYGVAKRGGPFGYGFIFSLDPSSLKYKVLKNFRGNEGSEPYTLIQGNDGKLYGSTGFGDRSGSAGLFYSFDPTSSAFKILRQTALGELTVASDGIFYGISTEFVYSYNPLTGVFQDETPVPSGLGGVPIGTMIESPDGNLYGAILEGGINSAGALFSYSIKTKSLKKVFDFTDSISGLNPTGKLTLGSDGNIYTITTGGGAYGHGTIVSFNPTTNVSKVIHNFDGNNGGNGGTILTEGKDGKLYGMTFKSDFSTSIFYSIDKDGNDYRTIRNFNGSLGFIGLLVNDKIYGVAPGERTTTGIYSSSYIFSYQSAANLFQKVTQTNHLKENAPIGHLLQATDGRFYGLTRHGGGFANGGIFSFNPATRMYTMHIAFNDQRGYEPVFDGLTQASNGKLYGMTTYGGTHNSGVIFSFDPGTSRYVVLKNMPDGFKALTGFSIGNDGKLYATYTDGNSTWKIVLFSIDPLTDEYKEVTNLPSKIEVPGIFMQASDGILYTFNEGEILSYNAKDNILKRFPGPAFLSDRFSTKLTEAADHKLYGMLVGGEIFSFNPSDNSFSDLFPFPNEITRYSNFGDLLYASDGLLYGSAYRSFDRDATNSGILYSFNPLAKSFKLVSEFNEYTGGLPFGQLVELNTAIPPIISITDKKMFEGETAELTVSLNRISMDEVKLNYRTVAGTANDGQERPDYLSKSGQITIPPGEVSATISVPLLEDELMETRETFTVVLQKLNEALVQLGDSVGVINIKNGTAPTLPPGGEIITIAPKIVAANETRDKNELMIKVTPNPSSGFFTLHIAGKATDRVSVTVTNLSGQVMNKFDGVMNNSQLLFGQNYRSGSYFVRVVHGRKSKTIKLVKTSK